jgi:mycothiol system anti-sigma-R factor
MDCRKVRKVVFLYTDNEMDGELLISFQEHVSICPECARRTRYAERLVTIFRQRCVRATAPDRLRQRILTSLPHRRSFD